MDVEKIRKPMKGLSIEVQDVDFIYEYPHIDHKLTHLSCCVNTAILLP